MLSPIAPEALTLGKGPVTYCPREEMSPFTSVNVTDVRV